jgi:hypothetical protein
VSKVAGQPEGFCVQLAAGLLIPHVGLLLPTATPQSAKIAHAPCDPPAYSQANGAADVSAIVQATPSEGACEGQSGRRPCGAVSAAPGIVWQLAQRINNGRIPARVTNRFIASRGPLLCLTSDPSMRMETNAHVRRLSSAASEFSLRSSEFRRATRHRRKNRRARALWRT